MNKNIMLCGVGGQGTVLASKLLAAASMAKGINVMSAETIGMAQRGGSVFSHLRMGDEIYSPMLAEGTADIIIGFEPAEAVRMLPYLKPDGLVVTNSNPIMPVTTALRNSNYTGTEMLDYLKKQVRNLIVIDGQAACEYLGSGKVLNMVLLGAALEGGNLPITIDDLKEAVRKKLKPELCKLNFRALEYVRAKRGV